MTESGCLYRVSLQGAGLYFHLYSQSFIFVFLSSFYFLAEPQGLWDLSSPTRD